MKRIAVCLLTGIAVITSGCSGYSKPDPATPATITPLTVDQVEQLLPYMTDLKKSGEIVRRTYTSELAPGQTLVQHQNSQSYTFSLWVDESQHPVMPPKGGDPVAARAAPVKQNGSFVVTCIGGCTVNTSGGPPCTIVGCDPIDNSCGCTPIECPGCLSAGCLAGGWGALAGGVIML